jgi:arginase family enzyme
VGFDVVELSSDESDRNSPFAVAKLIYKMLGFKLASSVAQGL